MTGLILDRPSPLGLYPAARPKSSSTTSVSALAALLCSLCVPHCSGRVISLLFPFQAFYCGFDWQFSNDDWCWAPSTCSLALVNSFCISRRQTFNQCISLFTVNCYCLYKYLFTFCERSSLLWCYSWQLKSINFGKLSVYLFCLLWFVVRVRV